MTSLPQSRAKRPSRAGRGTCSARDVTHPEIRCRPWAPAGPARPFDLSLSLSLSLNLSLSPSYPSIHPSIHPSTYLCLSACAHAPLDAGRNQRTPSPAPRLSAPRPRPASDRLPEDRLLASSLALSFSLSLSLSLARFLALSLYYSLSLLRPGSAGGSESRWIRTPCRWHHNEDGEQARGRHGPRQEAGCAA